MFDLSALVVLTILNLIALVQIASNIIAPAKLQRAAVLGAATICLATSLTGLAMALLVPSPIVGIASITIAALVNLFAVLSTGLDRLSDPTSTQALRALRGLARLAIVGAPHEAVLAGVPNRRHTSITAAIRRPRWATSAPHSAPVSQPLSEPTTPPRITRDPLPRLLEAASRPIHLAPRANRPTKNVSPAPASARPLTPRQNFIVPRRPNQLPTSSLAFLLRVDPQDEPDIFADARASMSERSALARRVTLVSDDPRRPSIASQSSSVWPTTFSGPDPVWKTSYARIPALTLVM
jgi:hypothetical protein